MLDKSLELAKSEESPEEGEIDYIIMDRVGLRTGTRESNREEERK